MSIKQLRLKKNIQAILVRAGHTAVQTALGLIGSSMFLNEINWKQTISAIALATLVSVLKSISIGMPEMEE